MSVFWGLKNSFLPLAEAMSTTAGVPAVPEVFQGVRTGVSDVTSQHRKAATQSGKRTGEGGDSISMCLA